MSELTRRAGRKRMSNLATEFFAMSLKTAFDDLVLMVC